MGRERWEGEKGVQILKIKKGGKFLQQEAMEKERERKREREKQRKSERDYTSVLYVHPVRTKRADGG